MQTKKIKVIDIGHANLKLEDAQSLLEIKISQTAYEGTTKVIKVITGHGTGKLRATIRQWFNEQEGRFQAIVHGEDYHMFNKVASDMRSECNINKDPDFGKNNSAITYVWLW